jgi:hypothetical protein
MMAGYTQQDEPPPVRHLRDGLHHSGMATLEEHVS